MVSMWRREPSYPHFDLPLMDPCRNQCLPLFKPYPYLLEEEELYVPPVDPDSSKFVYTLSNLFQVV